MWRVSNAGVLGLLILAACGAASACDESRPPSAVFVPGVGGTPTLVPPGSGGSIIIPTGGTTQDSLTLCAQAVPPTPLTRWSALDLDGTLDDLFGPGTRLTSRVLDRRYGRDVSIGFVSALRDVARERVKSAVADTDTFEVCELDEDGDSCIQPWLRAWGEKLYRRPLTSEQLEAYVVQFQSAQATLTPAEAAQNALVSMILSPYFALRMELGDPITGRLSSYEVAARLSHFATRRSPDAELRERAASNAILEPAERLAQARRLWKLAEGQNARAQLHLDWLELSEQRLPQEIAPELRAEMVQQSKLLIDDLFENQNPTLTALLTTGRQPLTSSLAAHYGLPDPGGDGFSIVMADPTLATGILSQGLFLSAYPRPTLRGLAIFRGILCGSVPDHSNTIPYDYADGATPRERITQGIAGRNECKTCHDMIDPFGFALEAFDDQGRLSGFESNGSIRASAVSAAFEAADPAGLGQGLAQQPGTVDCAARHYLEHALDRDLTQSISISLSTGSHGPPPVPIIRDEPERRWTECLARQAQSGPFNLQVALELLVQSAAFTDRSTRNQYMVAFDTSVDPLDHAAQETSLFIGAFLDAQDNETLRTYESALAELKRRDNLAPGDGAGGAAGASGAAGADAAGSAGDDNAGGNGASSAP